MTLTCSFPHMIVYNMVCLTCMHDFICFPLPSYDPDPTYEPASEPALEELEHVPDPTRDPV